MPRNPDSQTPTITLRSFPGSKVAVHKNIGSKIWEKNSTISGDSYENLPDTYVIFICDFDPFGDGLYRYTINTICRETGNSINDGIVTIYLNAHGKNNTDIPDELLQFLDYVKNTGRKESTTSVNLFVRHIQEHIDNIKQNRSMEERYMLLEEMMRNEKHEGNIEGKQEFLLDSLESKFAVSPELKEIICAETNPAKLKS